MSRITYSEYARSADHNALDILSKNVEGGHFKRYCGHDDIHNDDDEDDDDDDER